MFELDAVQSNCNSATRPSEEQGKFVPQPKTFVVTGGNTAYTGDFWKRFVPQDVFNPEESSPLIVVGNRPIILRGEVTGIKGKVNQGKSQLWGLLTAAVLSDGRTACGVSASRADLRLLILDTEQSEESACERVVRGIVTATGSKTPTDRVVLLILAGQSKEDTRKALETAIAALRPDIIVVDGIAQLFPNFNDPDEADLAMRYLQNFAISDNRPGVVWVLHENKNKDDNNAKGHLGSRLEENAAVVLTVKKGGDNEVPIFTARTTKSRHRWPDDIAFTIDNGRGIYVPADNPSQTTKGQKRQAQLTENLATVQRCMVHLMDGNAPTTLANLKREIARQIGWCERTAERKIKELEAENLISPQMDGCYFTTPRGQQPRFFISKEN